MITADRLPALIAEHPFLLIHVWATWNSYDRRLDAILIELQSGLEGHAKIVALDFDDERNFELLRHCHVVNLPTLLCFLRGEHRETVICPPNKERVATKLHQWLREAEGAGDGSE
jgi:hypothetical protein